MKTMLRLFVLMAMMTAVSSASARSCLLSAYISDDDGNATNLRSAPGGAIAMSLPIGSYSYMLELSDVRKGWWKIIFVYTAEEGDEVELHGSRTGEYWIHNSVLCLSTTNYGGQRWCLRATPGQKGKPVYYFTEELFVHPLEVRGGWVKVKYKGYTGWIEEEKLCDNPLTNCS